MKIYQVWSVALLALSFLEASESNKDDENPRKDYISSSSDEVNSNPTLSRKRKAIIDPLSEEEMAVQKLRYSSPLIISDSPNMLFQDLVEKVSARGPTDTGVEIVIEIKNVIQHDPKTFVEKVEYELAGRRSDLLVGSSRNGFWKINPNADPNEIKAIGFIAALCLKHKIILPFPLEPIYFLAMTGRMNIDSLTEIFREFEPEIYSNLRFLRGNCVRRLNELKLSFSEFCLADEPVNHANLERYIYFKIKTVLYHQNESVLNSFLQGVRLVISPAVINREYTFNSIMEIISPPYDYTAAQLRSACPELDNYKLYSQQYDLFFRAVDNLTRLQRIKLLKLFTNFDRLPEENGKFLITFYQPDRGQHLLPMAMYCYEQLMLTPVESYEQMLRDLIIVADNYD